KILQLLRECCPGGCHVTGADDRNTVSRLAEQFDLSLSTVSHHLKELRIAGLIVCEKRGQTVYCAPNEAVLRKLQAYLRQLDSGDRDVNVAAPESGTMEEPK
ncbi:MAG: ArsR family transcriptional regulator, partial [Candidatus Latescibacterota bacterium]